MASILPRVALLAPPATTTAIAVVAVLLLIRQRWSTSMRWRASLRPAICRVTGWLLTSAIQTQRWWCNRDRKRNRQPHRHRALSRSGRGQRWCRYRRRHILAHYERRRCGDSSRRTREDFWPIRAPRLCNNWRRQWPWTSAGPSNSASLWGHAHGCSEPAGWRSAGYCASPKD